ncbi:MAG: M24 family metallopeptidase [Thermomicrobiales bacterium]
MATLPKPDRAGHLARLAGPLRQAEEAGCAGLVLVDSLNQYWASGYNVDRDASGWERPCALIVPLSGEPVFVLNEICEPHAKLAIDLGWCWVTDLRFYVERPRPEAEAVTIQEWGSLMRDALRDRALDGARLACDSPAFCRHWLGDQASAVDLVDASGWVRAARMVKDEAELVTLRRACELTDGAMAEFATLIRPGEVAMEVAWEVQKNLFTAAARAFPDARVEGKVLASTGLDTACVNAPYGFAGRRFAAGDSVITIVILSLNGYAAENERTFFVAECPPAKRPYFETAVAAQAAGRAAAVAGNAIRDIDRAAQAVIDAAGMGAFSRHRTGHGIGLSGHEPPGDMAFNTNPLESGMTFTVEPGIYVPGVGGFRHSDTVLIDTEPVSLTAVGRGLEACVLPTWS